MGPENGDHTGTGRAGVGVGIGPEPGKTGGKSVLGIFDPDIVVADSLAERPRPECTMICVRVESGRPFPFRGVLVLEPDGLDARLDSSVVRRLGELGVVESPAMLTPQR